MNNRDQNKKARLADASPAPENSPQDTPDVTPVARDVSSSAEAHSRQRQWRRVVCEGSAWAWHNVRLGWGAVRRWAVENSIIPFWLPKHARHPAVPFLAAVLLEVLATAVQLSLELLFPDFVLQSTLNILGIVLVALTFGSAPSLLAALIGSLLVEYVAIPPYFMFRAASARSVMEFGVMLSVGAAISILASRNEVSRRQAVSLAARLASEQERLDTVIESAPDAITIHDAQGRFVRWNHAALASNPASFPLTSLDNLASRFAMSDRMGVPFTLDEYPVARALRGEVASGMELHYRSPEGVERDVIVSAAPLHNHKGEIDGAVTISHNVTELRATEREAARRATQLEVMFATIADGVLVFDSQTHDLQMNPTLRNLLGLDTDPGGASQPIIGRDSLPVPYVHNGAALPQDQWPLTRVLQGKTLTGPDTMDVCMHALSGREISFEVSGAPLRDEVNGSIRGAILVFRDVTERRQLEHRTHEALEALLSLAEMLVAPPEDMVVSELAKLDAALPADSLVYTSSAHASAHHIATVACQVLGCSRVGITAIDPESQRLHAIAVVGLAPEEEERWWNEQRQLEEQGARLGEGADPDEVARFQAGEVIILDMARPPYDHLPNPYHATTSLIAPMRAGDKLVGILSLDYGGVPHTFTSEEVALAGAVARFGAYVVERERLLRERAEALSEVIVLQEANRRMDRFVSIAGHELRTPLTTAKMNLQLAQRQLERLVNALRELAQPNAPMTGEEVREAVRKGLEDLRTMIERMAAAAVRQERLVNDLLDVSRIGARKLELVRATCDLVALTRDAVQEQRLAHTGRTIDLKLATETIMVRADADRLTQVISNYLTNALKYSPAECPVTVCLRHLGDHARLEVRDRGIGIPAEQLDQVWGLFHRVPGVEVQSGSGVGLGLGLHLARELIERHGGQVGAESHVGEGSTFWFTVPVAEAPAEDAI